MNTSTETRTIAGRQIHIKTLNPVDRLPIADLGESALSIVDEFGKTVASITGDPHLSDAGKAAKLTPARKQLIDAVAALAFSVASEEAKLDQREAALLAVPSLDDGHTAAAAVDVEVRQWWRGLTASERADMLAKFNASPEHRRIEIALLRSPIALMDLELRSIREGWDQGARLSNPAETLQIEAGRRATHWARETVMHAAGAAQFLLGRSESTLETIVAGSSIVHEGAWAFGFNPKTVAEAKRVAGIRKTASS